MRNRWASRTQALSSFPRGLFKATPGGGRSVNRDRSFESRLQRDIRDFFGDYHRTQSDGLALLQEANLPGDSLRMLQSRGI